jgi:hypothetical protein
MKGSSTSSALQLAGEGKLSLTIVPARYRPTPTEQPNPADFLFREAGLG